MGITNYRIDKIEGKVDKGLLLVDAARIIAQGRSLHNIAHATHPKGKLTGHHGWDIIGLNL